MNDVHSLTMATITSQESDLVIELSIEEGVGLMNLVEEQMLTDDDRFALTSYESMATPYRVKIVLVQG